MKHILKPFITTLLLAPLAALHAADAPSLQPPQHISPPNPEKTVLSQADHVWHMADGAGLKPHGEVKWGGLLEGADRDASLVRGGDGKAVHIEPGGYLELANDKALKIDPRHFTLAIRLRDASGAWLHPILGSYGSDKQVTLALRGRDARAMPMASHDTFTPSKPTRTIESWLVYPDGPRSVHGHSGMIEALWGATEPDGSRLRTVQRKHPEAVRPNPLFNDVSNAVMRVNFPASLIGPRDWHDLVVRFTGPKLQLFINGVLVDEEFPIGQTRERTLPFLIAAAQEDGKLKTGFHGLIDHVAVWNRALSDAEVVALSGGPETVAQRELAILGPEASHMQYFRARGHNRKVGDMIPYWDEEQQTLRMFYLILRRNMHSKWDGGHGGLEIWQASTKDLKSWTHHPVTIPITEQWEAANGTGAVAFLDGKYHFFYPSWQYGSEHYSGIQHAVSTDGIHFVKQEPHPFIAGGDCEVFQTGDGVFHMITSGPDRQDSKVAVTDKALGTVHTQVRLTSTDLKKWTPVEGSFIESDKRLDLCPNVFQFGDWHYYLCGRGFWRSKQPFGPWEEHSPLRLDKLSVPKTAAFGKNRRIYAGFLTDDGWGGNAVLRELVQDKDGRLGTRFVPELIPAAGDPLPITFEPKPPTTEGRTVRVVADQAGSITIPNIPGDYRLRMEIEAGPEALASSFGIGLCAASASGEDGCDLLFEPGPQRVRFSKMSNSSGEVKDNPGGGVIEAVEGMNRAFQVDIIVRHDIIDAEIGGFRAAATRFWNPRADRIRLFTRAGTVTFRDIRVQPLTDRYEPYPGWRQARENANPQR